MFRHGRLKNEKQTIRTIHINRYKWWYQLKIQDS
jgi:hypothetical protein